MQVALDLLGVADRVVEVVAREDEAQAEGEPEGEARAGHLALLRPHRGGGRAGPLHDARVVAADGGRDVASRSASAAAPRRGSSADSRLLLEDLELGGLLALAGGLGLLAVDGAPQLALALLELRRTPRASPSAIWPARVSLAVCSCTIWAWTFWTSGWPSLNFSLSRERSTVSAAIWALRPATTASAATWGIASRLFPRLPHLRELLERRLDVDAPGLGGDVSRRSAWRSSSTPRTIAALGHEQVLGLIALEAACPGPRACPAGSCRGAPAASRRPFGPPPRATANVCSM